MARNALATTARAVKAAAVQWLVLFFLTFVLACPAISMAADAAATAPAATRATASASRGSSCTSPASRTSATCSRSREPSATASFNTFHQKQEDGLSSCFFASGGGEVGSKGNSEYRENTRGTDMRRCQTDGKWKKL